MSQQVISNATWTDIAGTPWQVWQDSGANVLVEVGEDGTLTVHKGATGRVELRQLLDAGGPLAVDEATRERMLRVEL